jgi:hypothetical protein
MDLRQTIPGGSTMVKPIVWERGGETTHVEDYDVDARVEDMLDDFHGAQLAKGRMEELGATAKAFYDMFSSA